MVNGDYSNCYSFLPNEHSKFCARFIQFVSQKPNGDINGLTNDLPWALLINNNTPPVGVLGSRTLCCGYHVYFWSQDLHIVTMDASFYLLSRFKFGLRQSVRKPVFIC